VSWLAKLKTVPEPGEIIKLTRPDESIKRLVTGTTTRFYITEEGASSDTTEFCNKPGI
jgi:hypothetical protein